MAFASHIFHAILVGLGVIVVCLLVVGHTDKDSVTYRRSSPVPPRPRTDAELWESDPHNPAN